MTMVFSGESDGVGDWRFDFLEVEVCFRACGFHVAGLILDSKRPDQFLSSSAPYACFGEWPSGGCALWSKNV